MKKIQPVPIISLEEIKKVNFTGKKVVLIGGAFDIIHIGHIYHFEEAKSLGDILVVHITTDERYEEKRQKKPVFPAIERAKIVSAIKFVDFVLIFDGRHFDQDIVDVVHPDILFFNQEAYENGAREYIENTLIFSGEIIVSNSEKIKSSSIIKKSINTKKENLIIGN